MDYAWRGPVVTTEVMISSVPTAGLRRSRRVISSTFSLTTPLNALSLASANSRGSQLRSRGFS